MLRNKSQQIIIENFRKHNIAEMYISIEEYNSTFKKSVKKKIVQKKFHLRILTIHGCFNVW